METISVNRQYRTGVVYKVLPRFFFAIVFMAVLIFVPAGSLNFVNGWLFLGGILVPMIFTFIYLLIRDPELLEKRVKMKEKEDVQKKYIRLSLVFYVITYILPGLDFRYRWSSVPGWLVIFSLVLMLLAYGMFIMVMLQNRYASRIIEIQKEQKLIDTGLYSVVRHPMYLSAIILYFASAFVLGSYYMLIPMLFLPVLLAVRIQNEEKVLRKGLPGYEEYMKKVRYRIFPFIW